MTDYTLESDLDRVADIAAALGTRIRDHDPRQMFDELSLLCENHPGKAAQLLMCFAVWFDPDQTTAQLVARARSVSGVRTLERTA